MQPLTPVEIIRSAMLLRETVPFLAEEAAQIREKLDNIATKKSKIEQQVKKISSNKLALEKEHRQMKQLIRKKAKIRSQIEDKSAAARQKSNSWRLRPKTSRNCWSSWKRNAKRGKSWSASGRKS